MAKQADVIIAELEPLLRQAEREWLWIEPTFGSLQLSPRQLRERMSQGKMIWPLSHWRLVDPQDVLIRLEGKRKIIDGLIREMEVEIETCRKLYHPAGNP